MVAIPCTASFERYKAFVDEWTYLYPKSILITAVACAALGIASGCILGSVAVTGSAAFFLVSSSILCFAISATLFTSYVQQSFPQQQNPTESQAYEINRQKLIRVMHQTLRDLKNGFYEHNGRQHVLDMKAAIAGVKKVEYPDAEDHPELHDTRIRVLSEDCLDAAQDLCNKGFNPLVLDLANADEPGGGYLRGCRAQEETICRRSTLSVTIDSRHKMQLRNFYPFNTSRTPAAGLYVPTVTVFRDKNYQYLDEPFDIAVAVIAAPYKPPLSDALRLSEEDAEIVRQRVRTTLEMAYRNNHDAVVLGALGCGAFGNPPKHIAEIFHEVIHDEYPGCFKEIVFAIFDDHNSGHSHNPKGNHLPFKNTFDPD